MQNVTNDNFEEEILNSDIPVLLEFYSDGCMPCKRLSPTLAELEEEYHELKIKKMNVAFGAETAGKYSVMSVPTIIFFKEGQEVHRISGLVKKAELEEVIKEVTR
ncbi:thioredoxin [Aminipila butyrica]|uniref:Thioredoxin n=1 Tax=Aminipila butyrica TaxID=433296 RepID=A0A858BTB7_9FIRM|nr:thioredoxin [Aminipila butyrica]QIB68014.1 thioredoxin [Aminipila butyrica]